MCVLWLSVCITACAPKKEEDAHVHNYVREVTIEPTCTEFGLYTYTCECGDSYTFPIANIEHTYGEYVYDNNATYYHDGTETAVCECGAKKTRVVEESRLTARDYEEPEEVAVTEINECLYAKSHTVIHSNPGLENDMWLNSLKPNEVVRVTGITDNGWYRFIRKNCELYVPTDSLISRQASDYRKIDKLSDLTKGTSYYDFLDNTPEIELVAYTYNGVTVLMYDYTWTSPYSDTRMGAFHNFNNFDGWTVTEIRAVKSVIDDGGIVEYLGNDDGDVWDEFTPVSMFQVY